MKLKVVFLILTAHFSFTSEAQEIIWPQYELVEVPDSVLNEKAVFLKNTLTMGFNNVGQTDVNYFKRILVLSDEGAEELHDLEINLGENVNMIRIGGRIIKENGKIINLTDTDKFKTFKLVRAEYSNVVRKRFTITFPDLEVGDVIDVMYDVKIDSYILSSTLYIEGEYPSLYSRITLRNYSQYDLTAYAMNSAIQPNSKVDNGINTLHWERKGVRKNLDSYFHAPTPDQPCLIYSLWERQTTLDYATVYYYDYLSYPDNFTSFQSVTDHFIEQGVYTADDPIEIKVQKLIGFFQKEYAYETNLNIEPTSKVMGYIKDKKINEKVFFILMQKFLRDNKISYWVGYSQSLLKGPFFNGVVSLSQNDKRFLVIELSDNQQHFLFGPNEGAFFFLDEIPFYLEGNQAVGMNGDKGTLDKLISIELPQSKRSENTHYVKLLVKKEGETYTKRRDDHLSGHYSSMTRGAGQSAWLKHFALEQKSIDNSTQKSVYPYDLDVTTLDVNNLKIANVEDSLKSFTLKDVLERNIFDKDEESIEEMSNYLVLPFEKNVKYSLYYQSDVPLVLKTPTDIKISNSVGEISCKSSMVNESVMSISITLAISDRYLQGDAEIAAYKSLLDKWTTVTQLKYEFVELK